MKRLTGRWILIAIAILGFFAVPAESNAQLLDWLFPGRAYRRARRWSYYNAYRPTTSYYGGYGAGGPTFGSGNYYPSYGQWGGWNQIPAATAYRPTTTYRTGLVAGSRDNIPTHLRSQFPANLHELYVAGQARSVRGVSTGLEYRPAGLADDRGTCLIVQLSNRGMSNRGMSNQSLCHRRLRMHRLFTSKCLTRANGFGLATGLLLEFAYAIQRLQCLFSVRIFGGRSGSRFGTCPANGTYPRRIHNGALCSVFQHFGFRLATR